MNFVEGEVLYVAKPLTWTSFNLVSKIRWKLQKTLKMKKLKVGHAGTLDPIGYRSNDNLHRKIDKAH